MQILWLIQFPILYNSSAVERAKRKLRRETIPLLDRGWREHSDYYRVNERKLKHRTCMGSHTDTRRIRDAERVTAQPGKLFFDSSNCMCLETFFIETAQDFEREVAKCQYRPVWNCISY